MIWKHLSFLLYLYTSITVIKRHAKIIKNVLSLDKVSFLILNKIVIVSA